jgi:hypothetical protein
MSYSIVEDIFFYNLPAWQLLFKLFSLIVLFSCRIQKNQKIRSEEQKKISNSTGR